jgi:hypothetical protein
MRFLALSALILLASTGAPLSAQEWRGIKVMRSSCQDVKRVLGVAKCEYPRSTYRMEGEVVEISFVSCRCPIVCHDTNLRWNLPLDTVVGIHRELQSGTSVADFEVDRGKWTKTSTDFIGEVIYSNEELGIRISAVDGRVLNVTYYPPLEKNKQFLCPKCSKTEPRNGKEEPRSLWFNAYGHLNFEEEKRHLDKFASKLHEVGPASMGYIVTYRDCLSSKAEIQTRAQRAREYILSAHGIEGDRIKIIDGGQRDEMLQELHIRPRAQPPPRTFSITYPRVGCEGSPP